MDKITEKSAEYRDLELKSTFELTQIINKEDHTVPYAVEKVLPEINNAIDAIYEKMKTGGRLFYIGAGTSGRLGILDASECPPTFGVDDDWVIGIISGGDKAIRKAQEFAEDDDSQAWVDLAEYQINSNDCLVGIAASGTTPYVLGGLREAQRAGILTICITCNKATPVATFADHKIEVIVGPEVVTGSTRMKAGTAQKLVLNTISTTVMIKLGRVIDNKMVDMKLSNNKLVDRGTHMVMQATLLDQESAKELLLKEGSVRKAILAFSNQ